MFDDYDALENILTDEDAYVSLQRDLLGAYRDHATVMVLEDGPARGIYLIADVEERAHEMRAALPASYEISGVEYDVSVLTTSSLLDRMADDPFN